MTLWTEFFPRRGAKPTHKWTHYIPIYERHLERYLNRPLTLVEIGCGGGGSLQMWKRWLGPHAQIVGVDIDERCKDFEEAQITVRIGDQSDTHFLAALADEFGPIDVVIDDGSHVMDHVRTTFDFLYPLVDRNGVYIVEDLHTAYWKRYGGGVDEPANFFNRVRELMDELHAPHARGKVEATDFTQSTMGIHVYDSVVVFERGSPRVERVLRPRDY